MRIWLRFFLGSPSRFLGTVVGIGIAICLINPVLFERALNQAMGAIIAAVQPLVGPALAVVIVLAGLRKMLGGGKK
jgi:formate-dependent nitrite reductase membrane component NrfD